MYFDALTYEDYNITVDVTFQGMWIFENMTQNFGSLNFERDSEFTH